MSFQHIQRFLLDRQHRGEINGLYVDHVHHPKFPGADWRVIVYWDELAKRIVQLSFASRFENLRNAVERAAQARDKYLKENVEIADSDDIDAALFVHKTDLQDWLCHYAAEFGVEIYIWHDGELRLWMTDTEGDDFE